MRQLKNMVIASLISIVMNIVMLAVGFSVDFRQPRLSRAGQVVDLFGRPGWVISQWFLPGHDLVQVLLGILCSTIFYAIILWTLMTTWSALRRER
jgi:hypothetical protein